MRPASFSRYPDLQQSCQSNKWRFQVEEEIFTREEAASYLKVDKGTITQWIRSGRLQAAKINPDKPKS
ncbi:helix-turn-helix domain-containing protein, partial [Escherichia albertii]|nr:helix-turn-helix domain-containing protein [Escherichia albertii]